MITRIAAFAIASTVALGIAAAQRPSPSAEASTTINGLKVPKGSYTLYVLLSQPNWKLIVNKQTDQWGLEYHQDRDLGRVDMTMSKPSAPVETFKITLDSTGGNKGKLTMEWADTVA